MTNPSYTMVIQSRPIYPGPEERSFSELFDLTILCNLADDQLAANDFNISIKSDLKRFQETAEYFTNQQYMGNVAEANWPDIRHNIQIIPEVGFYGSFFQYTISKKVPQDGNFDFMGMRGQAIPVNADQEFLAGLGTISNGF